MSKLRGMGSFDELWERRTTLEIEGETVDLMALQDLVQAKKTQRDKDWPMIRRLVEQSYFSRQAPADAVQVEFWLRELRTPELLAAVAEAHPETADRLAATRPAIGAALKGATGEIERLLIEEERAERVRDREYWEPLRREVEMLRRSSTR